jgi:hypothetical protein
MEALLLGDNPADILRRPMYALNAICGLNAPLDALPDLWPHVWAWISFLDAYLPSYFPAVPLMPQVDRSGCTYLAVSRTRRRQPQ